MNKKQAVIIVTLLVLIVCAGVLATKVNSPLYVNGDLGGKATVSNSKSSSKTTDFFAEARLSRAQTNDKTLQTLKAIIDDTNATKESKEIAGKKYNDIALASHNEEKIEQALKGKGFEDVVCSIEDAKVRVIVKANEEKLTDQDVRQIKDVVLSVAKIKDIEIEPRQ